MKKEKILEEFVKWCDEPMSSQGNDRAEMFEKIWESALTSQTAELKKKIDVVIDKHSELYEECASWNDWDGMNQHTLVIATMNNLLSELNHQ